MCGALVAALFMTTVLIIDLLKFQFNVTDLNSGTGLWWFSATATVIFLMSLLCNPADCHRVLCALACLFLPAKQCHTHGYRRAVRCTHWRPSGSGWCNDSAVASLTIPRSTLSDCSCSWGYAGDCSGGESGCRMLFVRCRLVLVFEL